MMQNRFTRIVLAAVFLATGAAVVRSQDPADHQRKFVTALEVFDSAKSPEDYRRSADLLETIVADGVRSGAVYYNLGNAYFRSGQYGRAILNYRKAIPFRPRDPYLKANLQQAISLAPGRLAESHVDAWWRHVLFWTDWMSYPAKADLFFGGLVVAAVIWVLVVYFRNAKLRWLMVGLVVLSTAVGIDLILNYPSTIDNGRAVITSETIARKGMGDTYEVAFSQPLRDGAEFTILSSTEHWTLGRFDGIGDGWVRNVDVAH